MRSSASGIREGLDTAKLRLIGPTVKRLPRRDQRRLARELTAELDRAVRGGAMDLQDHRWTITGLQFLAPDLAARPLIEALAVTIDHQNRCPSTRNRLMRALGEVKPVEAIPTLVDVICRVRYPIHKHLAGVCLIKIIRARGEAAETALSPHRPRLTRDMNRLRRLLAETPPIEVRPHWRIVAGSANWRQAMARAIKTLARLLNPQ